MRKRYVPALGYDLLTPLYDPLVRVTTREIDFKRRLVEESRIGAARDVLDVGCGTGTLLILARQRSKSMKAIGLDGDWQVLRIAKSKAKKYAEELNLVQAFSFDIPFADCSFDRVFSSLMLHHLTRPEKVQTLREIFRILRPNGELHVADWGRPHNLLMRVLSIPVIFGDGLNRTTDNIKGLLPALIQSAGFEGVSEKARFSTMFGTLSIYSARKPDAVSEVRHSAQSGLALDVIDRIR